VRVRFFSLVKDLAGKSEDYVELKGNTVSELLAELGKRYPKLGEWLKEEEVIVLVNGEVAPREREIREGDDIAVVPPLSGGAHGRFVERIEPKEELGDFLKVLPPEVGAVAVFVGVVKGLVESRRVTELVYEAYEPYASKKLAELVCEEIERHGLATAIVLHKQGVAKPGEPVLFIAVASRGRREALNALASIVERVKREALVWKLERREDGEYWVTSDGKRIERPKAPAEHRVTGGSVAEASDV